MPNVIADGFIEAANFSALVSKLPLNADFVLGNAVAIAISNAAILGQVTCTVNIAAFQNLLVQALMQRLTNLGYTSTLAATTLTVSWANVT